MKKAIGFGNGKILEENPYIGKWVIIYPQGLSWSFSGKFQKITGNYAILNPFYSVPYTKKDGKIYKECMLTKGDLRIPLINAVIEPTKKSYLENLIVIGNEKRKHKRSK